MMESEIMLNLRGLHNLIRAKKYNFAVFEVLQFVRGYNDSDDLKSNMSPVTIEDWIIFVNYCSNKRNLVKPSLYKDIKWQSI